jgi:hypothetical protein
VKWSRIAPLVVTPSRDSLSRFEWSRFAALQTGALTMSIRVSMMGLAVQIDTPPFRRAGVQFGRPAPELAIWAAMLIGASSVLTGIAQIVSAS